VQTNIFRRATIATRQPVISRGFRAGRPAIRIGIITGAQRDFYTYGIGARDEVVDLTQFWSRLYNIEVCAPLSWEIVYLRGSKTEICRHCLYII